MRIIVSGLIGQYPNVGGTVWDYLQYAVGFRDLGHEVWYLEDTGSWCYNPITEEHSADCSLNVAYVEKMVHAFGLGEHWLYRNEADGRWYGARDEQAAEQILREADVLVNVAGSAWLRDSTAAIPHKLYMDGDPMFTHIKLSRASQKNLDRFNFHTDFFTFGLNIGQPDCLAPVLGYDWKTTVQPVALDLWQGGVTPDQPWSNAWTTAMNWVSYDPQEFNGHTYGQKDLEFLKFIDLPEQTGEPFVLAMGQGFGQTRPTNRILEKGWRIVEPDQVIPDHESYRQFLLDSKAEWSVAKNGYVAGNTGWFSCRTACYLAAGRPAVVQDTTWSRYLPSGSGVHAYTTLEEAAQGVLAVAKNYAAESDAARAFAAEYFEAKKVCVKILEDAGIK